MTPEQLKEHIFSIKPDEDWPLIDQRAHFGGGPLNKEARIMPTEYQPDHLRKVNECVLVFDSFLSSDRFEDLLTAAKIAADHYRGWGRIIEVADNQLCPS